MLNRVAARGGKKMMMEDACDGLLIVRKVMLQGQKRPRDRSRGALLWH
jgi:hypothetical protein